MDVSGFKVSRAQFEENLREKRRDATFRDDISPLLVNERTFDIDEAFSDVMDTLIAKLPGDTWKKMR